MRGKPRKGITEEKDPSGRVIKRTQHPIVHPPRIKNVSDPNKPKRNPVRPAKKSQLPIEVYRSNNSSNQPTQSPLAPVKKLTPDQSAHLQKVRDNTNISERPTTKVDPPKATVTLRYTKQYDPVVEGFKGFYTQIIPVTAYHDRFGNRIQIDHVSDENAIAALRQNPLSAYATMLNHDINVLAIQSKSGFYRLLGGEEKPSQGIVLKVLPNMQGINGSASKLIRSGSLNDFRREQYKSRDIEAKLKDLTQEDMHDRLNTAYYQIRAEVDQIADVLEKYHAKVMRERPF